MPDTITTAVPQQTPPQDAILHPAQVYFLSRRLPGIVHLVQYDQSLPYLAVELYEGDEPYTAPDGAAVNIRMAKPVPSDKKVYNPAYGISEDRHTVYIAVTPQMTVVAGCTNPVIEVVVNGGVACTGTLRLEIDPNPVQESDLIDTDEYKTLEEILAEAQAAAQIVQDNEQALQDVHNNLSAIQNAAANAQAAADSARDAEDAADRAAIESQKALGFRSYFGGQVVPDTDGDLDPSRPMSTPTAASVTIKARGDRIAGLTMAGKTTQEGTGDPSPENIRMISGVGMYDQCVVLDGSGEWFHRTGWGNSLLFASGSLLPADSDVTSTDSVAVASSNRYSVKAASVLAWNANMEGFGLAGRDVYLAINGITTEAALKEYLTVHPLTVWYRSVDYAKSTGPFYTVVELSDDPYRAVGFELNAPLFDGDSLKVGGKSGFDQMMVLDGSEDEEWQWTGSGATAYAACPNCINIGRASPPMGRYIASDKFNAVSLLADNTAIGLGGWEDELYLRDPSKFTSGATLRSYLQSHPLTVFYKSVDYTEENDIPVALERHEHYMQIVQDVQGLPISGDEDHFRYYMGAPNAATADTSNRTALSSHYSLVTQGGTDQKLTGFTVSKNNIWIYDNGETAEEFNAYLQAQINAGTPVQVLYELATPVSYARPVPTMIAQPGEDGTFTVTGENSLSVLLKAFQDGGDAASTANAQPVTALQVTIPTSAWTSSGSEYRATVTASGVTSATQIVNTAPYASSSTNMAAVAAANAVWTHVETAAGQLIFHADTQPTEQIEMTVWIKAEES